MKKHLTPLVLVIICLVPGFSQIEPSYVPIRDGFTSTVVNDILRDSYGLLMSGTRNGLQKSDVYKFETFKARLNDVKSLLDNTFQGLTAFGSPLENQIHGAVNLTNLLISDESMLAMADESPLTQYIPDARHIDLMCNQKDLTIEFAALQDANSQRNQCASLLTGHDSRWIYNNGNFASNGNLQTVYEFDIMASNALAIWNEDARKLFTSISPSWWKTWSSYLLYCVIFTAGLLIGNRTLRRRIQVREREKSTERELAQARELEKAYDELKKTQSQLIHSEKMASLGELTAGIAHEIQNPLNFVNNFSEVSRELLDEMKGELDLGNIVDAKELADDVILNLEKIHHHGNRADSIVKGMLQHSRSSSSVKEPTDINALCDEYLRLSYHGLRAKDKTFNAQLVTDFDATIGKINVVPQDIGRAILNLMTNAFYAVNEKKNSGLENYAPTVSVGTKNDGDEILIIVKDNGGGIPSKVVDKIFQPFFTTKPTGQGTGLGLSLSYDIVTKAHEGVMRVETKENEGTTFTIILPKTKP